MMLGPTLAAAFLLGCIQAGIGLVYLLVIGCAAGKASGWLRTSGFARWLDAIAGTVFLGLALRIALSGRPSG